MLGIENFYRSKSAHFWVGQGLGVCPVIVMVESRHRNWQGGSVSDFLLGVGSSVRPAFGPSTGRRAILRRS